MSQTPFSFQLTVTAASSAPAWFTALAPNTWSAIAAAGTINAVRPTSPGGSGPGAITTAWTGGCVNPALKELLLVANGGHSDYYGNEVYGLRLDQAVPAWQLLAQPTPANRLDLSNIVGSSVTAKYLDGRQRALHTCNQVQFRNGKAWITAQTAIPQNAQTSSGMMSWDRYFAGVPVTPGGAALAWADNAGPWLDHGVGHAIYSDQLYDFSPSCYDPTLDKIWQFAQTGQYFYSVNGAGVPTVYNITPPSGFNARGMWAVACPDLRIAVLGMYDSNNVAVFNLDNPSLGFVIKATTGSLSFNTAGRASGAASVATKFPKNGGAVYHAGSKTILFGDPSLIGGFVYKLAIPVTGSAYNAAGVWSWSAVAPSGASVNMIYPADLAGAFSKFNLIDMGSGASALVCVTDINGPTYVYKVPAGGL